MGNHGVTDDRVLAHRLNLVRRQLGWLEEDGVRHTDLADVVEQRAATEVRDLPFRQTEASTNQLSVAPDALGMFFGLGVAGIQSARKRLQR